MKSSTTSKLWTVIFFLLILLPAGVFGAPIQEGGATFRDVEGKEWILSELRSAGNIVRMDRQKLAADNLGGVYTINFRADRSGEGQVNGMGAPNRYFAPYKAGVNKTLSIGNLASTMMAAFREPEGLGEREYFDYLFKVTRWDLKDEKLELYSSDSDGTEAVLVYTQK